MSWAAVGSAAIAVGGSYLSNKDKNKNTTSTTTQQHEVDPRLQEYLYGADGSSGGLLTQLSMMANQQQNPDTSAFNTGIGSYLGNFGANSFVNSQKAAERLQATNLSPIRIMNAEVNAPEQNNVGLGQAFNDKIYGNAAENQYLRQATQGALNQSTNTFNQQQRLATQNLQQNILPGIKSNSIISGGYGGSRQGIAEGRALGDFAQAQQDTINQFGQNNTNAAVGAQAAAFDRGQDRSLSALLGLSGQQYGVAAQNAGLQQQASLANQSAEMQNRQQNTQAQATGVGLASGLLGQAYGYNQNANNAGLSRLTQISGALAPYTGYGGTTTGTQSTPYYSNTGANVLGGAAAGLGLYNQFKNSNNTSAPSDSYYYGNF